MTPPLLRLVPLAVLLVAMPCVSGACRALEASRARHAMQARLDPLVGKSKDQVFAKVGAPTVRRRQDGQEVWSYFLSYGSRASGPSSLEAGASFADGRDSPIGGYVDADFRRDEFTDVGYFRGDYTRTGSSRRAASTGEAYDSFSIFFRDGVAVRWSGHVRR